ncbi:hypothetical protein E2C01_054069 [Portunus trituberculatus]|uniref:Uncharacterized protein n=1 Tax=Portunus trituberculatus TaxID=210409 RepID=A0A5B7GTZ1_PORTR|nr:hypothetical protein [Portunus trituberculatus]
MGRQWQRRRHDKGEIADRFTWATGSVHLPPVPLGAATCFSSQIKVHWSPEAIPRRRSQSSRQPTPLTSSPPTTTRTFHRFLTPKIL